MCDGRADPAVALPGSPGHRVLRASHARCRRLRHRGPLQSCVYPGRGTRGASAQSMRHTRIATIVALSQATVLALLLVAGAAALRGFVEFTAAFREATEVTFRSSERLAQLVASRNAMQESLALIRIPDIDPRLRQQAHDRLNQARTELQIAVD